MIEAKNISLKYGEHTAISEVSAKFSDGIITAILGSNGAGKSTLLKILSGWLKPDCGEIFYDSTPISRLCVRELAQKRAVLEQECNLGFDYSVLQTVKLSGFSGGFFGAEASDEFAQNALAEADLAGFGNRLYTKLSGGEKRRVQLARALCQLGDSPYGKALLLDEPAASLDPRAAKSAMKAAKRAAERGACVVAVLHDPNLAFDFCQNSLLLKDSHAIAFGNTSEILNSENLSEIYSCPCEIIETPITKTARF